MQGMASSRVNNDKQLSPRLERAKEHVLRNWFPINQKLLTELRAELADPKNIHTVDSLLTKIKSDFALFIHCLKTLIDEEHGNLDKEFNPIGVFHKVGVNRIRKILEDPELDRSVHSFDNMSDNQASIMQQAFVSASAAEVISENQEIDPDYGYSVQLLRSLGETLIAWNYPKTYTRIIEKKLLDQELQHEFLAALGFTPNALAISLAKDWGLNSDIRYTLGEEMDGYFEIGQQLRQICNISEQLAIANDPTHHANAKEAWEFSKDKIRELLGSNGISMIQQRVHENCAGYIESYPTIFASLDDFNPEAHIITLDQLDPIQRNQWIKFCSGRCKDSLLNLYSGFSSKVNRNDLITLVKDIIPQIGFSGGCIYTYVPAQNVLVPQVKIGKIRLIHCNAIPCQERKEQQTSPIIAAYSCSSPIVEAGIADEMGYIGFIASVFGASRKVGVLYLEMPDSKFRSAEQHTIQQFKAVLQALNDCLHLQ